MDEKTELPPGDPALFPAGPPAPPAPTASVYAEDLRKTRGLIFVHPYDDDRIIAGQGTVALEMLADHPDLDVIVAPIGGGGLISGVAIAAKALKPSIEIHGVQAALYPFMVEAVKGGAAGTGGQTIAEGIAVKRPAQRTRDIVAKLVSRLALVNEAQLEQAVLMLLEI